MSEKRDHTFAPPTLDDFSNWIGWHLDKALTSAKRSVSKIEREAAAKGAHHSGRTIILTFEAAGEALDLGIDTALGELKRVIRATQLDKLKLREIAEQKLRVFAADMKVATKADKMRGWAGTAVKEINKRLLDFDTKIDFALRQFDVGFLDPPEPSVPPSMVNTINVGVMSGSAIQQASPSSSQTVTIHIEAVREAVAAFENAIQSAPLPPDAFAEITGDLDTIKAQLAKPSPSRTILREAGHSLRNVVEGVVGGALTPHALSAAAALWAVLGLG